ncbi:uncharacterized protein LOC132268732 [Cornus florida]|uniref:uncharacterized protein LOC132268732 n=1 Tax=Cornus florida TaxID=4283 RepID=UPI00289CBEF5|nr:uncharacterized protein LOC132268732 [Cornus florida]
MKEKEKSQFSLFSSCQHPFPSLRQSSSAMEEPKGTIVFTTLGIQHYGFDIFSIKLLSTSNDLHTHIQLGSEHRLTDGVSLNFNGQFVDEDQTTLVYVSERTGASRIFFNRPGFPQAEELLPSSSDSHSSHDRPIIKNGRLYFVSSSAHQHRHQLLKSSSAVYSTALLLPHSHGHSHSHQKEIVRLTPNDSVDYSPAVSHTGKFIAVASYGSRPWNTAHFHDLHTDIVVFPESHPTKRVVVCQHGGWPTWSGDSTIYFHRQDPDGWWSVFRLDLPTRAFEVDSTDVANVPCHRITPPGVHCFTPAAMHHANRIVLATRRRESSFRQIEIFDLDSGDFHPVTQSLNPSFHHYNPFVSPESGFIGYHRFRGDSAPGDSIVPHLDPVISPVGGLRMLRINGTFPTFSPSGDLIAFNHDFDSNPGIKIVKSDGSKRWNLLKGRTAFYNSWSPAERNVIYSSIGPIFESVKATVQIARILFDLVADDCEEEEDIPIRDIKILTRDDTGNNAFPSCSPDGKLVVFRSGRSGHKNLYIVDAVKGECDGGGIRQLTEGPWIDTMPSWSPDGELIAFSSNRHNPDNVDAFSIYVIRPDGDDVRRIQLAEDRERINHVCFSADGEWLLFTANLGGVTAEPVSLPNQFQPYGDLYVVRLDGSGLRRLTCNAYENGTPAWHPGALSVSLGSGVGDRLRGQFDEPLWIHCCF